MVNINNRLYRIAYLFKSLHGLSGSRQKIKISKYAAQLLFKKVLILNM